MIDLSEVLTEAEPVSVETQGLVTVDGTKRVVIALVPLDGLYEVHDQAGFGRLEDGTARVDQQAILLGEVDPLIVSGAVVQITGDGPHAGRRYRLGPVAHMGSHLEAFLEDV